VFQNREWSALYLFLMDGYVSLTSNPEAKQPVKIWRDCWAFQSVILQDLLPFKVFLYSVLVLLLRDLGVVYIFRLI